MNKKYLVALIVVALFATASVSASTAFKKLTATERPDYKLVVNNDAVELQNNPITIDGVTYLPLREVATILDQDVNFDKGTITLNQKEGESMSQQIISVNFIPLRDFSSSKEYVVTLGPSELDENTLTIIKGDNVLEIYNFIALSQDANYELETNLNEKITVRFEPTSTLLDKDFLLKHGFLAQ